MEQFKSPQNQNNKTTQVKKEKTSLLHKFRGNLRYQKYLFVYTCLLLPIIFYLGSEFYLLYLRLTWDLEIGTFFQQIYNLSLV